MSDTFLGPKGLWFVRHGQSRWNVISHHVYKGLELPMSHTPELYTQPDHAYGLTDAGRQQAAIAQRFTISMSLIFNTLLTSPLPRAHETGRLLVPGRDDWHVIPDLRERDWGPSAREAFVTKTLHELDWWNRIQEGDYTAKGHDGESALDGLVRYIRVFREVISGLHGQEVFVAGHGEMIHNAMIYHLGETVLKWLERPLIHNVDMIHFKGDGQGGFESMTHYSPIEDGKIVQQINIPPERRNIAPVPIDALPGIHSLAS